MFYARGLPFNLARNPYYVSSFTFAANHQFGGYVRPGYNKLKTTLLQQEKANVERLLEPIKATWHNKDVSIVTDGWSNPQRRPLINFMVVSESGPMFIKSINCSGEVKDKYFITTLMKEVIDKIGDQNVAQVITDNAKNCKGAGELIEAKNIENNQETYEECHWITEVHGDVLQVKHFIMNHSMRLAMYNKFALLKLLSVADTQFAFVVVMLKRFKLIRHSLEAMVISEEWSSYCNDDVGKARFVKEKILDDLWWEKIEYILSFTAPIYDMIRACDTDKPCLHLVYEMWDFMIEKVKLAIDKKEGKKWDEPSLFYQVVYSILVDHWGKSNTLLHCLAHSLNPRYYSDKWLHEDLTRVAPHKDSEIFAGRSKCFKRLFPDQEDRGKVILEFANFSLKCGSFGDSDFLYDRYTIEPKAWWAINGSSTPILQVLAFKLLGQPSSSSCCERNWSTYPFLHSFRRNKLAPKRVEDLVFVHNNLRLLSRRNPEYYEEKMKMWDVGGDEFGTLEDAGVLELVELSLDEPEIEAVLFANDTDDRNNVA